MTAFGEGHCLQLVDGSGYIFRAFFQSSRSLGEAYRYRSDGEPVGGVHFFCNMLFNLVLRRADGHSPTHSAIVFDTAAKTFRHEIFPEYKAHRPKPPEDLVRQFPKFRDATRAFNFRCLELDGYEADDIIATLATRAREAGGQVTMISADKDLMQLVSDRIEMFDTMRNRKIERQQVEEKFGVGPERVPDVQALAGDSTDNIPGAPGIGVKTAAQLINQFGDLETLLAGAHEIPQPKRRQALTENVEKIRISKKLVELERSVPLGLKLDELKTAEPDPNVLLEFLREQEFKTLARRVEKYFSIDPPPRKADESHKNIPFDCGAYECIKSEDALDRWIEAIRHRGFVAVDTETTGLDEMRSGLVGVSLSIEPGKACYIPLAHVSGGATLLDQNPRVDGQLDRAETLARLRVVLEDKSILKIGQNVKYDIKIFAQHGINVEPVDDTMLMAFALLAGKHTNLSMDTLSSMYLNHKPIEIKSLIGTGKKQITFDRTDIEEATRYAGEDADITLRLWREFKPRLGKERVTTVYETLERPLIPVLSDMERTGIKVDRSHLAKMSVMFSEKIGELEKVIHDEAGETFNVGSPKQLGDILFRKLQLPGGQKTKAGGYSTGANILETLAGDGHKLPELVLEWRHMSKLKSTYTDVLQEHINPDTGRVHTSYNIAGANTGRLASNDPNLQNIPVRTEVGRRIREAFIAEDGHVLLSLDYSQIELRILAHIAGIEELQKAFRKGLDIHAMTASEMFGIPIESMDSATRRKAKAINFGVIYGISGFGLARNLHISRDEAQQFIDRYFERFPGIRTYMDKTIAGAHTHKHVKTLFGRRIHTPGIEDRGHQGRFAERAAINAPIQGTAADIIRRAMMRIPAQIEGMPAKMLLQVHDELLFEVRADAVGDVTNAVRAVMEGADLPARKINPSLVVDDGVGANWAEAH